MVTRNLWAKCGGMLAGVVIVLQISLAPADTITIGGPGDADILTNVRDATIFQNNVNNSNGAGPGIFAGTNGMGSPRRGLIEFDIAANVPAGSTINSVQLQLYLGQTAGGGGGNFTIELHKLTKDWGEGTTGSTSTTIGGTGQGFPANPGDATWNAYAYSASLWTNPGGDFLPTISASTSVGATIDSLYTWGSTSGMIADVQSWLDNPASNYGWALRNATEASANSFRAFYTKEWSNPDFRPALVVNFTPVPEPASVALLLTAVALLAARRVRAARVR